MTAVAVTSADGNTRPSVVQGAKLALKAVATHVDKTGQATFKSKDAGVATVDGGTAHRRQGRKREDQRHL